MPATEQTESAGQAGQILDCSHGWWLWAAALSYAMRQQFFLPPSRHGCQVRQRMDS